MAETLYTATATSTGSGRAGGRGRTDDGLLDVTLALPVELGGPGGATNPEQLLAVGWSSCFHSVLKLVAGRRRVRVDESSVVAEVSVHPTPEGGFGLGAALRVHLPGLDQATADDLVAAAHAGCPYSNATRGNVPVTVEAVAA
ncbi:organic hydroperoxide resistance protein [Umezawaea sp.]|uniref:organic hydroperoxide resistance protein n=1 Tax=Umezawaea sp. TaxID=1955258 RepID=UPI002ED46D94